MQFSTAKTEMAERLHDSASANETRVGEWLNITMHEIISRSDYWDWLQDDDTLAIVAGTQDYTISSAIASDVRNIISVRIESDGGWILQPLTYRTAEQFYPDPDLSTGRPESYAVLYVAGAPTLRIFPDPDANYTAQVYYTKTVADLSANGDTPPWPRFWDHVWMDGTEAIGLRFEGLPRAEMMQARFERGIQKMLAGANKALYAPIIQRRFTASQRIPFGSPWPPARFEL